MHNSCSVDEVIGRVIRNTKLQDTSIINDIFIWINEVAAEIKTKWSLQQHWSDRTVRFHKATLPCNCTMFIAAEHNGNRLPVRNSARHPEVSPTPKYTTGIQTYVSTMQVVESPEGFNMYQTAISIPTQYCKEEWYQEDGPGQLLLSYEEGIVRIHYKAVPHDSKGIPLIPDVESYKQAMYWYCRSKMIEQGWRDPALTWDRCIAMYSQYADQARAEISYWTPDRAEALIDSVSLLPPFNYYDSFGNFQA